MLIPLEQSDLTCGGKAAALRVLLRRGLPVPRAVCLPLAAYRAALPELPAGLREAAVDPLRAAELSASIRDRLQRWTPNAELQLELERLTWPLIVRSSASCEGDEESSTAGIFLSLAGVTDLSSLVSAIGRCWASLWEIAAWVALRRAGRWPGGEAMAVILQAEVPARRAGLVLSRDPHAPDQLRLEAVRGAGRLLADGEADPDVLLLPRDGAAAPISWFPPETLELLRCATLDLERELGRAVEVEWACDGDQLWLLQVRSLRPWSQVLPFPLIWASAEEQQQVWRWDREHNPEPLSPAHASLIALLEHHGRRATRQIVQGGFLYTASTSPPPEEPEEHPALATVWRQLQADLALRLADFAQQQDAARRHPLPHLQAALQFFSDFCDAYFGPLAGGRRRARRRVQRLLAQHAVALTAEETSALTAAPDNSSVDRAVELYRLSRRVRADETLAAFLRTATAIDELPLGLSARVPLPPSAREDGVSDDFLDGVRRHLQRYGSLAAAWDVAATPLGERPSTVLQRLLALAASDDDPERARSRQLQRSAELADTLAARLPKATHGELADALADARLARRIEEDDDVHFSKALQVLRRALLHAGEHFVARGWLGRSEEIFLLPIPDVLQTLRHRRPATNLAAAAARAGQSWEAARRRVPPLTIAGERLVWPAPPGGRGVLRGLGLGGVVRGRVLRAASLEELLRLPLTNAVVVCPTLLPALSVILPEIAALVTDHGGLLSHAACLARELGKTAVVGTATATSDLQTGETVWVDGPRGLVIREG